MEDYSLNIYNHYSMKASSILESVIAMAIISVVIVVAIEMTNQILLPQSNVKAFQLDQKVNELHYNTLLNNRFFDERIKVDKFIISKKVTQLNNGLSSVIYSYKIGKREYVKKIILNEK